MPVLLRKWSSRKSSESFCGKKRLSKVFSSLSSYLLYIFLPEPESLSPPPPPTDECSIMNMYRFSSFSLSRLSLYHAYALCTSASMRASAPAPWAESSSVVLSVRMGAFSLPSSSDPMNLRTRTLPSASIQSPSGGIVDTSIFFSWAAGPYSSSES